LRIYETIYICPPNLDEEKREEFSDMVHEVIYDFGGKIIKQECWGKRRLAYKVKHHKEGIYYYFLYGGDGSTVNELERRLKLSDDCIRFLTVRLDEELKGKKHKIFSQEELRLALQMEPPQRKKKKKRVPMKSAQAAERAKPDATEEAASQDAAPAQTPEADAAEEAPAAEKAQPDATEEAASQDATPAQTPEADAAEETPSPETAPAEAEPEKAEEPEKPDGEEAIEEEK